jgi:MSHA pilin protein MshC
MKRLEPGFTLIELVVIMLIIGVLAVFATGRFTDQDVFEGRGYHDELVAALRFARSYATASECNVQVAVGASSYAIHLASACVSGAYTVALARPDGGPFAATAPSGVSVTAGAGNHVFGPNGALLAGGGTLTVSGGGSNHTFTLVAGSGYVDLP